MVWPSEEEYEEYQRSLESDDPDDWHDDECHICGEPDCSGDCWRDAPWLSDEEEE